LRHHRQHDAQLAAAGCPQNLSMALFDKAASAQAAVKIYGLRPLSREETPAPRNEEFEKAAATMRELVPRPCLLKEAMVLEMDKQAKALVGVDSLDTLLAVGLINPENIQDFVDALPDIEETQSKLASLVFAVQLGLQSIPKTAAIRAMIVTTVDAMYALSEENRFLEVTYANGDKEVLYFKDFASGAMIESVVRRAKKLALKRYIASGTKGITTDDLKTAVREEFKENEDLPNTTNPDDWAKIAGRRSERIVHVKPVSRQDREKAKKAEVVMSTGHYL